MPLVLAFNGKTGIPSLALIAYDLFFTGGVRAGAAPVGAHGTSDVLTASGPGGGPVVREFDGTTGLPIGLFSAYSPAFTGGVYISGGRR